jgi:cytochrome P450
MNRLFDSVAVGQFSTTGWPIAVASSTSTSSSPLATLLVAAALPLALLVALQWHKSRSSSSSSQSLPPYPPGPKPHWLLGNLKDLPNPSQSTLDAKLLEWTEQYGLFFTMTIPLMGKVVVISDPALLKRVTVTKNRPKSPTYKVFESVVGSRSMLVLSGQQWAVHRRGFNPGFTTSFIRETVTVMVDKLRRFVKVLDEDVKAGVVTGLHAASQTFTSDVIVSLAFGEDWGGTEAHPARVFITEMTCLLEGILLKPLQRILMKVGLGDMRHVKRSAILLDNEMRAILERRLAAKSTTPATTSTAAATNNSNTSAKDICSLAIKTLQGERPDGSLTEEDKASIVDQLKTFYFAGHDTTSILITWAIWLLSQHPEILQKVRDELREHQIWSDADGVDIGMDTSSHPSYDDLQKCSYLEAVLKETLRLYPPAGIVSRWGDDPDETYNGYRIGGAVQMLAIYTMHRNPQLWICPNEFRPDRFLDGSEGSVADKFVPFSRGPRDCIGRHFAMLEAKLAVSCLANRYDLECVNPNESVAARITYVPRHGGLVKFRERR